VIRVLKYRLFSGFFAFFALVGCCSASYIQMGVTVSPPDVVAENVFPLNLTVVNSGDEAAHDVLASLKLPAGFSSEPVYAGLLQPNMPFDGAFRVSVSESVKPGTYPYVLKTHYTDANAYQFSTVSPGFIRYKKPTPSMLRGKMGEVSISEGVEKTLELEVSNLDEKPHKVYVRVHTPDEIAAGQYPGEIAVDARGIGRLQVPVKSFGALPGSAYVVFASLEYDDEGLHYGSTAAGTVKITVKEESEVPSWLPMAALGLLVVAFVGYQVVHFIRPKDDGKGDAAGA
jgi:hypothetical protein